MRLIGSLAGRGAIERRFPRCGRARRGSWSFEMDCTQPADVAEARFDAGVEKPLPASGTAALVAFQAAEQ